MSRSEQLPAGLAEVVGAHAGIDHTEVTPGMSFAEDLGIDSMTMVEVVVAVEDRFGMLILDDDWTRFRTVGDLADYVVERTVELPRG
jgi:acyl carrier protein